MINSVIFIVVIIICLYLIFKALSRQGSNPNGFGAKFMLKRWAKKNNSLYEWAIKNTIVDDVHDILDLGIGSGTSSKALANHFKKAQVVGIDKSKDAVEYARTLNKEIIDRGQVGIIQGDVHQLGL
ncbi:MAG: class I SAM-dependent methyltransferase, partial [Erysipelotrichales bacterium]